MSKPEGGIMVDIQQNIMDLIKQNIPEDSAFKTTELSNDLKFVSDLGYDSVRMMGLLFFIEQQFDIEIINSPENYKFFSIETIEDLIDLLNTYN